ncbi:MAG: hypothetical protein V4670_03970 [Bacteroidota bacterium]
MKKQILYLFFILLFLNGHSQEIGNDSVAKERKVEIKLDLASRYIWRGQSWGGNYVVFQPSVEYKITKKITTGVWATTNFKRDYFYADGSSYKGYQEIDFYISYKVKKYLTFQLSDYYWPSVKKVEGVDNNFFNYGSDGVKTMDFNLLFDFSEVGFPFNATISTLVAGNDFKYDSNGENPKQNFTTYAEVGYDFENIFKSNSKKMFKNIDVSPSIGVVFNNQAKYYVAGDYDKPSLVNMSLEISREFEINKNLIMPVSITFTHNAASKNTETFGRNFLIFEVNLTF